MEQTRLQDFFSARKRSTAEGHPSKRRKLDEASPRQEAVQCSKVKCKKPKPNHDEIVSLTDDHGARMRKTNSQLVRRQIEESLQVAPNLSPVCSPSRSVQSPLKTSRIPISTPVDDVAPSSEKSVAHNRSPLKLDHWVNEQAKNVLHSRGAMMISESLKKGPVSSPFSSPNPKTPEKSVCFASTGSPKGNLNTNMCQPHQDHAKSTKSALRSKFAHLLEDSDKNKSNLLSTSQSQHSSSPTKTGTAKLVEPAHEKFKHLATSTVSAKTLPLPQKYKTLLETFRCADSVLYLLNQRSEVCTFDRLKSSVQQMSGRSFELKHLGMLKAVYPSAYTFRQEKGLLSLRGDRSSGYQLTVEANFRESLLVGTSTITPTVLITRRLAFESSLLAITLRHHQKFIRKLNINLEDSEIHRWHPHFKLEEVPEIEPSNLPESPIVKNFTSAAEVLLSSKGSLVPKVAEAFKSVADKASEDSQGLQEPRSSNINEKTDTSAISAANGSQNVHLKGVSQSLLERIRLKEQLKNALAMTRDPAKERRLAIMERLPDVVRILKAFFTTEKKAAIALDDCLQKLQESYGSAVSVADLQEHVNLLSELVPQWLTITVVRKTSYVKLAKDSDINSVLSVLKARRNEEESAS